jgi:dTDP-3-amino-3,4,6-trideoxy-alpha-D-glucose transaminase
LQEQLTAAGIGTMIHYPVPPHLSGAYAGDGCWSPGTFPLAENLAATVLSLPMGPHLTGESAAVVSQEVIRQTTGVFK